MRLTDFLNDAYLQYGQHRGSMDSWDIIEKFIYKPERCLRLLYHYLDLGYHKDFNEFNFISLYRSQHIFVTFLLGLGIAKRYNLLQGVNVINKMPDEYLWMLTSMVHDYGYFKQGLREFPDLINSDYYNLLDDECNIKQLNVTYNYSHNYSQFLTYPYDVIKDYYTYKKDYISKEIANGIFNKDGETVDHGIYGACKCYEEYCDFYISHTYPRYCISPNDDKNEIKSLGYNIIRENNRPDILVLAKTEPLLYKTACIIAAQHNMFRSPNPDIDLIYSKYGLKPLLSTEPVAISKNNPLLFLLSVVDTIECTKCFENLYLNTTDKKSHLHSFGLSIKSILDNVNIDLNDDCITIDYSILNKVIDNYSDNSLLDKLLVKHRNSTLEKRKIMHNSLDSQIKSVIGLKDWVKCESMAIKPYVVKILL